MRRSPDQIRPDYRQLRIFAIDPMVGRGGNHQAIVQIRFEDLRGDEKRPSGSKANVRLTIKGRRVEVVDVDASGDTATWLRCVDLDDAYIAMQLGLEPSESDPQFHQQMVYAVAMRTLEQFDRALGRIVYFRGRRRLRLVPHAFRGSNAFYHPALRAVLFGYFPASSDSPGENLPGQTIFTCLSHDIIAHEVTHAIVDRLRPHFNVATNPQVRAFHEAFADIVAVFQRLTVRDLVQRALQDARGDLTKSPLLDIAAQFGQGLGSGRALRTAIDESTKVQDVREEHALGAVLLAAIFDGFQRTYERRCADLLRIATGGTGELPRGALHPDLVGRLTMECVRTAQGVLTMCIRAFDYLPPADVDFTAFLRALVTADWELNPLDESGLRASVIESFRRRGIFAVDVGSLEVGALLLDTPPERDWAVHQSEFRTWVDLAIRIGAEEQRRETPEDEAESVDLAGLQQSGQVLSSAIEEAMSSQLEDVEPAKLLRSKVEAWFSTLKAGGRKRLGLRPDSIVSSVGFHQSHRVTADGTLRFGLVVQLVEVRTVKVLKQERRMPSGATLVIDVTGHVRFIIRATPAEQRLAQLEEAALAAATNALGWPVAEAPADPFAVDYRGMHEGRAS